MSLARNLEVKQQPTVETRKRFSLIRAKVTLGEKVIILSMVLALFCALALIINSYASIYITNKEIHQIEAEVGIQMQKNAGLSLQVTELSAPDRILSIAYEELGMELNDNKVKVVQN